MICSVLLLVDQALAALSFALRLLQANLFGVCGCKCSCMFVVKFHRMHLCTLDVACLAFQSKFYKVCSCNWSVSNTSDCWTKMCM